jgi:hypothetical protein
MKSRMTRLVASLALATSLMVLTAGVATASGYSCTNGNHFCFIVNGSGMYVAEMNTGFAVPSGQTGCGYVVQGYQVNGAKHNLYASQQACWTGPGGWQFDNFPRITLPNNNTYAYTYWVRSSGYDPSGGNWIWLWIHP